MQVIYIYIYCNIYIYWIILVLYANYIPQCGKPKAMNLPFGDGWNTTHKHGDFRMVYGIGFLPHKTILDTQFVTLRMSKESSRHYVSAGKHQVVGGSWSQ